MLEPAPGFEMVFDFGVEGGIVGYRAVDGAGVDEIEGGGAEGPWFGEIVDLEFEIGRYGDGLDGR